jgi:hypothetical protein
MQGHDKTEHGYCSEEPVLLHMAQTRMMQVMHIMHILSYLLQYSLRVVPIGRNKKGKKA